VTGGSGDDHITGDLDANSFDGADGNDTLEGGGTGGTADGADSFTGGPGAHDAVSYDDRTVPVTATAGAGNANGIGGCPGAAGCEHDVFAADIEDLTGGQEDDVLSGSSPTDNTLDGQGGDDLLRGSPSATGPDGADVLIGGGHGTAGGPNGNTGDLADFGSRVDNLTVSIGGGADGATGENDDVRSTIEKVTGGDGSDTLTGDAAVNTLVGGASDDTIAGGSGPGPDGADILIGGTGTGDTVSYDTRTDGLAITINGTAPDGDTITTFENATGGSGNDTLTGDGLPNRLTGGLGTDSLNGLAGADRLEARDGVADTLDCGTEDDVAVVDFGTTDTFTGCETVDAAAAPPQDPDPPANPDPGSGAGDPGGGGPIPDPGGQVDVTPPQLTAVSLTNSVFAVDPRGAGEALVAARAKRHKKGTTFRYTLSEPARVVFTIQRARPGRRQGKACRKPSRANRRSKKCTRFELFGRFAQQGAAGANSKRWSGKIGKRKVSPGKYRATLLATDSAGNRSLPKRLGFRVVRR
jgi:hypothetical protein